MKRIFAPLFAASCVLVSGAVSALAKYPERQITMIVPFPAGGGTDMVARILAEQMAAALGRPIIIENDGGAGGTTATGRAARAPADGYTLVFGQQGTHGAAPAVHPNLKYDPAKDFTPIGRAAGTPIIIVTRKDFPANTLQEFAAYVRKNQTKVNEAHNGVGSGTHAACTLLQSILGTATARVAYRGTGPSINDLVAGQVDFKCIGLGSAFSHVRAGTVKAIAVASPKRAAAAPEIPTSSEGGLGEFQVSGWNAVFAPKGLPREIQEKLNGAVAKALDHEPTRRRLLDLGYEIPENSERTPQALQKLVESEVALWSAVLKAARDLPN